MSGRIIDVSHLPEHTFGHRSLPWWGTFGFAVIEGTSLAVSGASYLYLKRNFAQWPPAPTAPPDLLVPTIGVLLLLLMIVPMHRAKKHAEHVDPAGVTRALGAAVLLGVVVTAVRALEFHALNVRWDEHAYGSVVWLVLGLHTALVIADLIESTVMLTMFRRRKIEAKHFPDVGDAAFYQYFLSLIWVPFYLLVFVLPRL